VKRVIPIVVFSLFCSLAPRLGASQENTGVEMKVKRVMLDPITKSPVVILENTKDKKLIPIWIGEQEALSIAMELEKVTTPRPLPYDLIRNILQGLGTTLRRITITDLRNNTYFANLTLKLKDQEFQIDSRPSDAIALALKMKAPIYASPQLLAKAKELPAAEKPGEDVRKVMGIQAQDLNSELASLLDLQVKNGVLVADVELGSPASKAGVQRGDIILKVNDKTIHKVADLESLFQSLKRAGQLKMEISRKGKTASVTVDLPS